jgi:hypothetical protein
MKKLFVLTGLLASSIVISCQKENVESGSPQTQTGNLLSSILDNPYEYAGEIHNIVLDKLVNNAKLPGATDEEIFTLAKEYTIREFVNSGRPEPDLTSMIMDQSLFKDFHSKTPDQLFADAVKRLPLDEQAILNTANSKFNLYPLGLVSVTNILNEVKLLENSVKINPLRSEASKTRLLGTMAVMRHSFIYNITHGPTLPNGVSKGWRVLRADAGIFLLLTAVSFGNVGVGIAFGSIASHVVSYEVNHEQP